MQMQHIYQYLNAYTNMSILVYVIRRNNGLTMTHDRRPHTATTTTPGKDMIVPDLHISFCIETKADGLPHLRQTHMQSFKYILYILYVYMYIRCNYDYNNTVGMHVTICAFTSEYAFRVIDAQPLHLNLGLMFFGNRRPFIRLRTRTDGCSTIFHPSIGCVSCPKFW